MKRTIKALLIISMVFLAGIQLVYADSARELKVYNTRLVTNDKEATFIEGEVSSACGQTIVLRAGLRSVAEKKMPDTGVASKFRIKVPAKNIADKNTKTFYVEEVNNIGWHLQIVERGNCSY